MKGRRVVACSCGLLLMVFCIGCQTGPAPKTVYYTLAYPAPQVLLPSGVSAVLRLEPIATSTEAIGRDMVYQDDMYRRDIYHYSRWLQSPAEMVQGLLLRDLRTSGLFKAVLSSDEAGATPYVLNTRLEAFRLTGGHEGKPQAALTIVVTMLDSHRKGQAEGILFQKTYNIIEPIESRDPNDLARGMSAAMSRFSEELLRDVAAAKKSTVNSQQ